MNICDEIKKRFIRLSRSQRRVAQFVIDNPNIVATHIASDVGKLIGVSESTVIRFCYAMDLSGFSELQEKVKESISGNEASKLTKNNQKFSTKKEDQLLSKIMNEDVKSILNTIQHIDEDQFNVAVKLLHNTNSCFVLGFRQSSPTASFVTELLTSYGKEVKKIEHNVDNIVQQISTMNKNSLLLVIALDSIYEDALTIAKLASNKKVKVIAITNSSISPLRDYADLLFTIGAKKQDSSETMIATHSLLHALIEGMKMQNINKYRKIRSTIEQVEEKILIES